MASLQTITKCTESQDCVQIAVPDWLSDELLRKTLEVWQPFYDDPLTEEDAKYIILSVGRLIDIVSPKKMVLERPSVTSPNIPQYPPLPVIPAGRIPPRRVNGPAGLLTSVPVRLRARKVAIKGHEQPALSDMELVGPILNE